MPEGRSGSRRRRKRTSRAERIAVYVTTGLAALAAVVFASTQPSYFVVSSALLRAAYAAVVTLAASRARRWTWLVLCGVGALVVEQGPWLGVAATGLLVAFSSVILRRRRLYGSISVALGLLALFHTDSSQLGRAAGVVCIGVTIPVLVSAYQVSPRRVRRRVHRIVLVVGGFLVLATVMWGAAAGLAYSKATNGATLAQTGLDQARNGLTDSAAGSFAESAAQLRDAHALLSGPWAKPALAVPILSQQAIALDVGTEQARNLAEQGAETSAKVDYDSLRYERGRADLSLVLAAQEPLKKASDTMAEAEARLAEVRSDVLIGPVAEQIDELTEQVAEAKADAELASMAADVAPRLLGSDRPRRYFVLFTTPAELRGLGGFMGNWAILTADRGQLELSESGRTKDLNDLARAKGVKIPEPDDLESDDIDGLSESQRRLVEFGRRYFRWRVEDHLQDITMPPDLPMITEVLGQIYPAMTDAAMDGTIVIDPYGLAGLLELTGPVTVKGYPEQLTSANVADILINRQYVEFADTETREQFLEDALNEPFERLRDMSLPSPKQIGAVLGPRVQQRRIMFWTFEPEEQAFLDRIGVSGRFGVCPNEDMLAPCSSKDDDFLAITTQNSANNKIDVYFKRKIEYRASIDPATGAVESKARVTLTNEAPDVGLPDAIIGDNDKGYSDGTNAVYFSIYSRLGLRKATVDGLERGVEFQRELGLNVYSTRLVIPSKATVVLDFDLGGSVPDGRAYHLDYVPQPTVNPDVIEFEVVPAPVWMVRKADGGFGDIPFAPEIDGTKATIAASPNERIRLGVETQRR